MCGVDVNAASSRHDATGNCYCLACYNDLLHRPLGQLDLPLFRCTICGQLVKPNGLTELDGRIACRDCIIESSEESAPTAGQSAGRPTAGEASAIGDSVPKNVLKQVTCPHCWHIFPPDQVLWVSQHSELLGDPVLGPEAQLRFRPSHFNAQGEAIDGRDMPCQLLACPRCHLTLPRAAIETEPFFVSVVGAPASGKSHFLTAMAWQLRRLLSARFGVAFNDADTLTNHALNEYEELLFLQNDADRLVTIPKTELQGTLYEQVRLGQQVISLPRPFLFTLRSTGNHGLSQGRTRLLCLYDNAGEHFQPGADSVASPGTQHLARSRVILFLYDPTQHPRFREACRSCSQDPQLFGAARDQRQEILVTEAAARVRRYTALSLERKHPRPLLVVVSKADVWAALIGLDLRREPLVSVAAEAGKAAAAAVHLPYIEQVSARLRQLLMRWTPEFVTAAEDFCSHVIYLPASALGNSPSLQDGTGILGIRARDIHPRWVTVPMLYALGKWGGGLVRAVQPGTQGAKTSSKGAN